MSPEIGTRGFEIVVKFSLALWSSFPLLPLSPDTSFDRIIDKLETTELRFVNSAKWNGIYNFNYLISQYWCLSQPSPIVSRSLSRLSTQGVNANDNFSYIAQLSEAIGYDAIYLHFWSLSAKTLIEQGLSSCRTCPISTNL